MAEHRWDTSDRASRLPSDWGVRRVRVLRDASYRCEQRFSSGERCGAPANQVDHIIPGDDHERANLQALCRYCHGRKSSAEGAAARTPRPRATRDPEPHPGLLPSSERVGGDPSPRGGLPSGAA